MEGVIICSILSAFFSGMEIAFISSNKIYLEIEKKQDNFLSKILTKLTEKPSKFIAAMLYWGQYTLVVLWVFLWSFTDESDRFVGVSFFLIY
jgi:Mg2+/Co2+ transporter CorB